jgi:predicted ATP-grasp superfamily ATP-dependent carboligase
MDSKVKVLEMNATILVVGFNVRPLARSAKKAGYRVLAVDFWGDMDLSLWADEFIAVLDQQPNQRPDRPVIPTAEALVTGVRQLLEAHGPVDYIVTSGGFDDHIDSWKALGTLGTLAGNSVDGMQRARDRHLTREVALRYGATVPITFEVKTQKQFNSSANNLELPFLVKPLRGSGGFHSRVLRSETDMDRYSTHHQFSTEEPMLVQELIEGTDASVSVLSTGKQAIALSVNEQLVGLPELGKVRTKAYCGNIVPLQESADTISYLEAVSKGICEHLNLRGNNGIDFVIDESGTPYFMEVNPRIQATIEAIELVTNANIVNLHIDACNDNLPQKAPKPQAVCARIIVYALRPSSIPDLRTIPGVVDIPIPGSKAKRGDPVCTVNHIASSRQQAFSGAWEIVKTIYRHLRPITSQS